MQQPALVKKVYSKHHCVHTRKKRKSIGGRELCSLFAPAHKVQAKDRIQHRMDRGQRSFTFVRFSHNCGRIHRRAQRSLTASKTTVVRYVLWSSHTIEDRARILKDFQITVGPKVWFQGFQISLQIFSIKQAIVSFLSNFMFYQTVSTKQSLKQNTYNCSHCEPWCTLWPLKRQLSSKSRLFSLH